MDLSNEELLLELRSLKGSETRTTLSILYYLIEVEDRGIYRDAGYSSLFEYCHKGLGYSEGAAGRRVAGSRCLREHPEVAELLVEGKVSLSNIAAASKSIKTNELKVEELVGKSYREVQWLTAPAPKSKPRERVKAIVVSKKTGGTAEVKKEPVPEREERIEIKFSVTKEVFNQFEELRAEFSNQLGSDLSIEAVFGRLLKLHRDRQKRNVIRSIASPCTDKRKIPVSIKKEVLERDQRQCTYIAPDGTRCTERHYLNFDHIVPFAKGGSSKSLNLRLLCSRHNQLAAEQVFGKDQVDYYVSHRKLCSKKQIN